jgi:tetratricopeptide (TPR) repeat protein
MENPPESALKTAPQRMCWWVGAAAFVLYLATLNHGAGLGNLLTLAEVNHWNWQPTLFPPVLYVCLLPFRLLPTSWTPLALNLFSAGLASLLMVVLARSVALLPHDRMEAQRRLVNHPRGLMDGPHAWLPPLFAAMALGFELSFWEHATIGSGEMLDLLLVAGAIWCLLEYRLAQRRCWLERAALASGLAVANNWMALAFLPVLAVAVLRLRLPRIVPVLDAEKPVMLAVLAEEVRILGRLCLWGLAGLAIVLVVPIVHGVSHEPAFGFWQSLRAILRAWKAGLFDLGWRCWLNPVGRSAALPMAATTLLPALVLCVRWPNFTTRNKPGVPSFEAATFYLVNAFLLLISLAVVLDSPFAPRQVGSSLGLQVSLLGLYYLAALSLGYYSGFFLVVFRGTAPSGRRIHGILYWLAPVVVYGLLGLTSLFLLVRNTPVIRLVNGPQLSRFARFLAESLPSEGAVVFSGDPIRGALLQAALDASGHSDRVVVANASAFAFAPYRAWLRKRFGTPALSALPTGNPSDPAEPMSPADQARLIAAMAATNRVCHLEYTFGVLLEQLHLRPRGMLFELGPYPAGHFGAPASDGEALAADQSLWMRIIQTGAEPLSRFVQRAPNPQAGGLDRFKDWARFKVPLHPMLLYLASWYSCALNSRGVCLQQTKQWDGAARCFRLALDLNPNNLLAGANLRCNQELRAGHVPDTRVNVADLENAAKYPNWRALPVLYGPCDEPKLLCLLSTGYELEGLWRQEAQLLERVLELVPESFEVRRKLAEVYWRCHQSQPVFRLIDEARAQTEWQAQAKDPELLLTLLTAIAWYANTNLIEVPILRVQVDPMYANTNRFRAEQILRGFIEAHPREPMVLDETRGVFIANQSYEYGRWAADLRLRLTPDYGPALVDKGACLARMRQYTNAIPVLTRALASTNRNDALYRRAEAYVGLTNLDAAAADLQELLRAMPDSVIAYQALADVARLKGDTNNAIRYYQQCLAKAAPGSQVARVAAARLRELQPQSR